MLNESYTNTFFEAWILLYFLLLQKLILPSLQGTLVQFSKYLLPVFFIQITFASWGMWGCEGEDEDLTQLKSLYSFTLLCIFLHFQTIWLLLLQRLVHQMNSKSSVLYHPSWIRYKGFIIKDLLFNIVVTRSMGHFLWAICWDMEMPSLYIRNQT